MLAKGPVHSAHLLCPIDSLREQARSHGFVVSHRFENTHRTCGSNRGGAPPCLRRGRYIQHICFARYTAFASKLASTDLRIFTESAGQPRTCGSKLACEEVGTSSTSALPDTKPSRASSLPQVWGHSQNLWACPKTCGSKLACEGAGTFSTSALSDTQPSRASSLPRG